ncbi:TPA: KH domain-containing protein [Candidatus Peregrinibacteria bacterium]|nr:KH domain-containing protein [Candidatus Peregrinibacteria bacterium]HIQ57535.1 KH domain-containing protein [Candidatus Gracilibacteria bacterium]
MKIPEIKDIAVEFINSLHIKFSSLIVEKKDERIWINIIPQNDIPKLIGYRGQNINAMQTILTLILLNKGISKEEFIVFDIDGYKKQNEDKIIKIIQQKIKNIEKYKESQVMPFLGPQERRMVHLYIHLHYQNYVSESFTDERDRTKRILKISKK